MAILPPSYLTHKDPKTPREMQFGPPPYVKHPNLSDTSLKLWPARIMMFETIGGGVKEEYSQLILPYLPEELKRGTRSKTAVRQTQTSAWVDKYGDALPIWHISGTTGWRKRWYAELGRWLDGYESWRRLEDYFRYYQNKTIQDAEDGLPGPIMVFFNFYDEEYWTVEPIEVNKYRNARRALLIGYEIKLVGIHKWDEPGRPIPELRDPGQFLGENGLFLVELQRQLEFLQALLSQLHIILGVTKASAEVLRAASIIQIGVGIVQAQIKNLQFGNAGKFGLSTEDVISIAQSILQFVQTISDPSMAIAVTGAVIQLIAVMNSTAINLFQIPSRIDLFGSGSFSSALVQNVETQTPIFPDMV